MLKKTKVSGFKAPLTPSQSSQQQQNYWSPLESHPKIDEAADEIHSNKASKAEKTSKTKLSTRQIQMNSDNLHHYQEEDNVALIETQKKTKSSMQKTKNESAGKATKTVRSLTDAEYEDLFQSVSDRMRLEYPSPAQSQATVSSSNSQLIRPQVSQLDPDDLNETLDSLVPSEDISRALDVAMEIVSEDENNVKSRNCQATKKKSGRKAKSATNKNSHSDEQQDRTPLSSIHQIRQYNKQKSAALATKNHSVVPSFSLDGSIKNLKKTNTITKRKTLEVKNTALSKEQSEVKVHQKSNKSDNLEKRATLNSNPPDSQRTTDEQCWSLTQECNKGVWVQCCLPDCGKWRYLDYMHDPAKLQKIKWYCSMNKNVEYNSCSAAMQRYQESHLWTYNTVTEGSIVWARVSGYPWWPAMVEIDPDTESFVFCYEKRYFTPVEYHVTFFDCDKVSRAWLPIKDVMPFDPQMSVQTNQRGRDFKNRLLRAVTEAEKAEEMSLIQRLRKYSFVERYEGKIMKPKSNKGDIMPSKMSKKRRGITDRQCEAKRKKMKKSKPSTLQTSNRKLPCSTVTESSCKSSVKMGTFNLEKELDEIEMRLSQKSCQSVRRQQSVSPSPAYKFCAPVDSSQRGSVSPAPSSNIVSNRQHNSQHSNSQMSQRTSPATPGIRYKSLSPVPKRKEFTCPTQQSTNSGLPLDSSVFSAELSREPTVTQRTMPDSVFTQELSGKDKLSLLNKSVFTQELSGAHQLSIDESLYTQELSMAEQSNNSNKALPLDKSLFTQELSGDSIPITAPNNTDICKINASHSDDKDSDSDATGEGEDDNSNFELDTDDETSQEKQVDDLSTTLTSEA